ncbi:MAG TPA: trehalose-6-phosphate synthase [Dokdonella sp.]
MERSEKLTAADAAEHADAAAAPLGGGRLIVVSNRVSADAHHAGGLAQAMHSALADVGGIWFGWSGRITERPLLHVERKQRIRFVTRDLNAADHRHFYLEYANRVLWPLLHGRLDLVAFERESLQGYLRVNARFADAIGRLARREDSIWVHDYHLIPLASELRRRGLENRIGFFLHVPVPPAQTLMSLPAHLEVLPLLAAYDLVGVQTAEDAVNLREYFDYLRAARHVERIPRIESFPIGIDVDSIRTSTQAGIGSADAAKLRADLAGRQMMLGVDRLDYSKGLPLRLRALERLLERQPELHGEIAFVQVAAPTRGGVPEYDALGDAVQALAGRINGRYAQPGWTPVQFLNRSFAREALCTLYRAARVGVVTPLRDGMNLVAKEYVAAQDADDPGVLVLSQFAGAARELEGALIVNPFDPDECADALCRALTMTLPERRRRWREMMRAVEKGNVHAWREHFLEALAATRPRTRGAMRPAAPAAAGGRARALVRTPSAVPAPVRPDAAGARTP